MLDVEDDSGTLFRDFSLAVAAIFLCLVVILLPFINPPKQDSEKEVNASGNLIVEVIWPHDNPVDIDTWILGPDNIRVGYSNKSGKIFNLLRDDTGASNDVTGLNFENAFSRGIWPGWYIINLHVFGTGSGELPIKVRTVLSVKAGPNATVIQFYASEIILYELREEQTVLRFKVKPDKTIDYESFSTDFEPVTVNMDGGY